MPRLPLSAAISRLLTFSVAFSLVFSLLPTAPAAVVRAAVTYVVTDSGDSGGTTCAATCTLRQAIGAANLSAGPDVIQFSIAGAGTHTITPGTDLPTVSQPVLIDGTTQPSYAGTPLIELSGAVAATTRGLTVSGGSTVVRGLAINGFSNAGDIGLQFINNGGNRVEANFVGTNPAGTAAVANATGIRLLNSGGNFIGGDTAAERNVISGNDDGIVLEDTGGQTTTGNAIEGNYIGTDLTGTAAIPNMRGIRLGGGSTNNRVGGSLAGTRNVISGNQVGINLGGTSSLIEGNYIGPDASGTSDLGNSFEGIFIEAGSFHTIRGNVISGNDSFGIRVQGPDNTISGNFIGTAANGTSALGNGATGVFIANIGSPQANRTHIGGTDPSEANVIAYNNGAGVHVQDRIDNSILGNSIHHNASIGIDLAGGPVTANDPNDPDEGANHLQNFPVLTAAAGSSVSGTLDSTASTTFRIEVFANAACDGTGFGEGETFIGTDDVSTDANGDASFSIGVSALSAGQAVTMTATDPAGNTSEFSACASAAADPDTVHRQHRRRRR